MKSPASPSVQKPRMSAKDFFFHLGAMIALYVSVFALLSLLFSVINAAFPQIDYYNGIPSISFKVAELIIIVPLFLGLSWALLRSCETNPEKRELGIKKWLTGVTLFVTGAVVAGDLITVLYYFLDGRDLTTAFLLKALAVLVVLGGVFFYYIQEIRNKMSPRGHKISAGIVVAVVLVSIALGFSVIGSPKTQRLLRYDEQKLYALADIQQRVALYYRQKGELPESLAPLSDSLVYGPLPEDPQGLAYEYKKTGDEMFEICATFNKESTDLEGVEFSRLYTSSNIPREGAWDHDGGYVCFVRTIDPDFFPPNSPEKPVAP